MHKLKKGLLNTLIEKELRVNTAQGRKNTQIFLTPDITPLTFLQGFHKEIYNED